MGIFSSISDTITAVTAPVISTANAMDESLSIATTMIHNRSVAIKDTDMLTVATDHAQRQAKLKLELQDDEEAAAIFTDLVAKMKA